MNMRKTLKWLLIVLVAAFVGFSALIVFMFVPLPLGVTDAGVIRQANEFGIFEGIRMQKYIEENYRCPGSMGEWNSKSRRPGFQYEVRIPKNGRLGQTVPIWLRCSEELTFEILVKHAVDSRIIITGGLDRQIEIDYESFGGMKTLELNTNMKYEDVRIKLQEAGLIANGSP